MKTKPLITVVLLTLFMQACSSGLIPYEIKDGYARVENWKESTSKRIQIHKFWQENKIDEENYPYTKASLDALFVMCQNQTPRYSGLAYQHLAGEHKLWVKAVKGEKEGHLLFNVKLDAGGDYGFEQQLYKNHQQVDVWMIDNKTKQPVTKRHVVELKRIKLNNKKQSDLWKVRCKTGTV